MSATEIIEEIKKLSDDDQRKVAAFLDNIKVASSQKPGQKVSQEFEHVADGIFTKNAELFRKLAQ